MGRDWWSAIGQPGASCGGFLASKCGTLARNKPWEIEVASGLERFRITSNSHVPRVAPPDEVEDLVRFDGIHVAAHAKMVGIFASPSAIPRAGDVHIWSH